MPSSYLHSITERLRFYKNLGEGAMDQIPDDRLLWQANKTDNSVYVIVKHISGNMISRFTDFLTADGEKPWREREKEFENENEVEGSVRKELIRHWEAGWQCLFENIEPLKDADLERTVYIRNEPHTVIEALNRQLGHYAYHIGQIVLLAKMICGEHWRSLSIPKGKSEEFNKEMISRNNKKG